jgi:hypothetical protein
MHTAFPGRPRTPLWANRRLIPLLAIFFASVLAGVAACGPLVGAPGEPPEPTPAPQNPWVSVSPLETQVHNSDLPPLYAPSEMGRPDPFASHTSQVSYDPSDRWLDDFAAGFAALDCEGDGDIDILFTSGDGLHSLWLGAGDGSFLETTDADIQFPGDFTSGAAPADADGDGDTDILLLNQHSPNRLLINDGSCHFEDHAAELGLHGSYRSVHGTWADLNADGRLDLYVSNWATALGEDQPGVLSDVQPDQLWIQQANGTFEDVSTTLPSDNLEAMGMLSTFIDWDGDGDLDMFQINDRGDLLVPNRAYRNEGNDSGGAPLFTDITEVIGFGFANDGMGIAFSDVDGDGDIDMFETGSVEELFLNIDGDLVASAQASGVNANEPWRLSWGGTFFDVDGDGDEDLTFVESFFLDAGLDQPELAEGSLWLFQNRFDEDLGMVEVPAEGPLAERGVWRAQTTVDVNGDGWDDMIANRVLSPPTLYLNNPHPDHRMLQVRLKGTLSNTEGRGAIVRLQTPVGEQLRFPGASPPFACGGPTWMSFGLGQAESAGPLEIRWPSGVVQTIEVVPAGHIIVVTEPPED